MMFVSFFFVLFVWAVKGVVIILVRLTFRKKPHATHNKRREHARKKHSIDWGDDEGTKPRA